MAKARGNCGATPRRDSTNAILPPPSPPPPLPSGNGKVGKELGKEPAVPGARRSLPKEKKPPETNEKDTHLFCVRSARSGVKSRVASVRKKRKCKTYEKYAHIFRGFSARYISFSRHRKGHAVCQLPALPEYTHYSNGRRPRPKLSTSETANHPRISLLSHSLPVSETVSHPRSSLFSRFPTSFSPLFWPSIPHEYCPNLYKW